LTKRQHYCLIVNDMITLEPIRALCGGEARFRLVRALYGAPGVGPGSRGLATAAGVDPAQAHRLLPEFVSAGLCEELEQGPFKRYRAVTRHPVAKALAETFSALDPRADEQNKEVDLRDAPVLRSLLWTGQQRDRIAERDAFRHYEDNWRFVRDAEMPPKERRLLERLKKEYGGGLING